MHFNQLKYTKRIFVYSLSIVLLFGGFFVNFWHVAERQWFINHQLDSESYIVGKMVKSRRDGIFSDGALTGIVGLNSNPKSYEPPFQYQAYIHGLTFDTFAVYKSQVGGQGIFFSFLDRLSPLPPEANLQLFQMLASLLSAIVLVSIILWFYLEFGICVAIFVMASAVFSQWLTVFGRNLYWSLWSFYLPIAVVMYFLRHDRTPTNRRAIEFGILAGGSVFVKCLVSGYEYITTTLIMMIVPLVYYGILDRWDSRRWLKGICAATFGSCFALFMSFGILCVQIWSITGNRLDGVRHIMSSLEKRTHGVPQDFPKLYSASLESSTLDVVLTYLKGTFFDFNNYVATSSPLLSRLLFKIYYFDLLALFLTISIFGYFHRNHISEKQWENSAALILTGWLSILAPLSWFVIFKAHSFIHIHVNFLVWQMPFTFFVFAAFGLVVQSVVPGLIHRLSRRSK